MRKIYVFFTALIVTAGLEVSPCLGSSIVASIFPVYDWVREISKGVSNNITLLQDSGADIHSFQPSADDIVRISGCDLFVYIGGESDEWAEGTLKNPVNSSRTVLNLLDILGDAVKEEEIIEGMEHEHHEHHDDEGEAEPDEHIWLSLRNAGVICRKLAETLSFIDPKNSDTYASNLARYLGEL